MSNMKCQSMWNQGQNLPRIKAGLSLQCQEKKRSWKLEDQSNQHSMLRDKQSRKSQRINVKVSIQCKDINRVESHREPIWSQNHSVLNWGKFTRICCCIFH